MKLLDSFMFSVVSEFETQGRFGTAHVYHSALNAFSVFWEKQHPQKPMWMKFVFDSATLLDFENHLRQRMLRLNTISTYMRMLRAIYYRALHKKFVTYVSDLFKSVYTGTKSEVKRAIQPADMGKVLIAERVDDEELELTKVWFALLFLLRGMPFADLVRLRKCDLCDGVIIYRRQKTGVYISVPLTADAEMLIRQCADKNRDSPYLLDILWRHTGCCNAKLGSEEEYKRYQIVLRRFNRNLKLLGRRLGIPKELSSYTARHTWATTAFHRKYAIGIISNALGHSSVKVTETYLEAFKIKELHKTNEEIISYTKMCALK